VQRMLKSLEKTARKCTHDMINQEKKMQWCAAGRESNGLASGRVTHSPGRHTTRSSIDGAAQV
jgi:hypothetical protein